MDENARKAQFSVAYIKAIAARLGLNPSIDAVDNDSVDLTLKGANFRGGKVRNPIIEIQLKCTSQNFVTGNVIKYPLSIKNYSDLRGENVTAPRYLMVLIVPNNLDDWIGVNDDSLTLFNCCYWVSLRDMPETTNKSKVTVNISLEQRVNPESLRDLMIMASNGEAA